jgi:hypothetical protein
MRRFGLLITTTATALCAGCNPPIAAAPGRSIAANPVDTKTAPESTPNAVASWTKLDAGDRPGSNTPTAGEDCKIAYDHQRACVYLYGGKGDDDQNTNELWSFDLKTRRWSRLAGDGPKPPPREDHSLILDMANDTLVLFGGEDGPTSNETWAYDLATNRWQDVTRPEAPARQEHVAVYDPRGRRMLVFGGANPQRTPDDETQVLDLDRGSTRFQTWSTLPTSEPRPLWRRQHAAAYDSSRHRVLVFGGIESKKRYLNDLWSLDLNSGHWSQVETRGDGPPPIAQTALSLDPTRDELIAFGGEVRVLTNDKAKDFLVNHIWVLSLPSGTWSDATPHPRVVFDHVGVFVPELEGMLVFGGSNFRQGKEHRTWLLERPSGTGPSVSSRGTDR